MNTKVWIQKAVSTGLMVAMIATYSMVTLAKTGKAVGELIVNGSDDTSFVMVNGEPAMNGRSIFASSTITTPESFGATVNLGKVGRISLAANTTFAYNVEGESVSGDLTAGSITVLNAATGVNVKTISGDTVTVNAGESANANTSGKQAANKHGAHWWPWVLIVGGAIVVLIWTAREGNDSNFGGSTTTVSPVR